MKQWKWAAASRRGSSHEKSGIKKQDAYRCFVRGDVFVGIVSDGAGSATYGGEGASLVCRSFASAIKASTLNELPTEEQFWTWLDAARDRISASAEARQAGRRDFAATMVCFITDGSASVVAHVGDGAAVTLNDDGIWTAASWPEQGEYASTTYFVTDDPAPRLRVSRLDASIKAAAIFTDGIERIALDLAGNAPHQPFFNAMIAPVLGASEPGQCAPLSKRLGKFLDSPRVLERTDDDKTLILVGHC